MRLKLDGPSAHSAGYGLICLQKLSVKPLKREILYDTKLTRSTDVSLVSHEFLGNLPEEIKRFPRHWTAILNVGLQLHPVEKILAVTVFTAAIGSSIPERSIFSRRQNLKDSLQQNKSQILYDLFAPLYSLARQSSSKGHGAS